MTVICLSVIITASAMELNNMKLILYTPEFASLEACPPFFNFFWNDIKKPLKI